jgi:ABC-type phosphate transport system substrate-binding protein
MRHIGIIVLIILGVFRLSDFIFAQELSIKIIVNNSNNIESLTKLQITKLFLKEVTQWDDNITVKPVDQSGDSEVRKNFSKEILGKKVESVIHYWHRKIFAGKGVPPPEKKSDKEVIEYVMENPGAIGYIDKNTETEGVKVIEIIQ